MEDLIREVERLVLDRHHLDQPLLRRPPDLAVGHLFKLYAHFYRDLPTVDLTTLKSRTVAQILHRGLMQAVRWVLLDAHSEQENIYDWRALDEEALSLLTWGSNYMLLATDHVVWSRGVMRATVDADQRRIRFELSDEMSLRFFHGQHNSDLLWGEEFLTSIPEPEIAALFSEWMRCARRDETGIFIEPEIIARSGHLLGLTRWAETQIVPELPASYCLDGYTIGDFATVYAALYAHSECLIRFELSCDQVLGPNNPVGSSCFSLPKTEWEEWVARSSALPRATVRNIINDLTFAPELAQSSLTCQPIVKLKSEQMLLSPQMFVKLHPFRMLAGALLASPRRYVYESMVESLEKESVAQIATQFRSAGLAVEERPSLRASSGDDKLTPDLIISDPQADEVLLVEYKHSLPPHDPAVVANRIRDLAEWVDKLRRYVKAFSRDGQYAHSIGVDPATVKVYPLLLFRYPMVIPVEDMDDLAMIDWCSLRQFFPLVPEFRLVDMWEWARTRPDVADRIRTIRREYREISVGEWIYEHPVLVGD